MSVPRVTRSRPRRQLRVALRYVLLVAILVLTLTPLLWMVITSLRGPGENVFGFSSILPENWSLDAYSKLFDMVSVVNYIGNTAILVVLTVASECLCSAFAGYALSRKHWRGRRTALILVLSSVLVPFEAIMVSLFVMIYGMGLVDNLLGVWLPSLVSPVAILIMRSAFMAVPDELEEAAVLDGAREWTRFWRIFLPSAKGALVVVAITTFIATWDGFLWPLLVLRSEENFTLTLGMAQLATTQLGYDERVVMAGAVFSIIPVLIVFALLQRHFYRGVGDGALKF